MSRAILLSVVLGIAWPMSRARAQEAAYCDLEKATPACHASNATNKINDDCRHKRRCDASNYVEFDLLGAAYIHPDLGPKLRYQYAWCEGSRSCSPYECDPATGELVRNPNCHQKVVRDRQKEAESSCTSSNNSVRQKAETCQAAVSTLGFIASDAELPRGTLGTLYEWTNSTPNQDPCGRVESVTTKDMGIGLWDAQELSIPPYDPRNPPSEDPWRKVRDKLVNPERKWQRSQEMIFTTGNVTHAPWWEIFSTRRSFYHQVFTYGSLRGLGDASLYTMSDPPKPLPAMVATFCGPNRASAFVQGYNHTIGSGATATPANINITSSAAASGATMIERILTDTNNVVAMLRENKPLSDCITVRETWQASCSNLPDGTYAHSMGAIGMNTYGVSPSMSFGSVNNANGGASFRNNCDPVPDVVQVGLMLLQEFPTDADWGLYQCVLPGQRDCLVKDGKRITWVSMDDPRQTSPCNGDACRVKWCAGRPRLPASPIWSGRKDLQEELSETNSNKCVGYQKLLDVLVGRCSIYAPLVGGVAGGVVGGIGGAAVGASLGAYLNCIKPAKEALERLLREIDDHSFGGHPSVKYNGYQVLAGLNNLGEVIQRPAVTGIFIQNSPEEPEPPLPVRCLELPSPP